MKDTSLKSREVIKGDGLNKETLYYAVLLGAAFIFITVLMIFGFCYHNPALAIYAGILCPLFLAGCLVSVRLTVMSLGTVFVENKTLVVRTLFSTKKHPLKDIKKISVTTNNSTGATTISLTCGDASASYSFKSFSKEEITHLRNTTSNH